MFSILKNLNVIGLMNCIRKYACPFFHPLVTCNDTDHLELTVVISVGKLKHRFFSSPSQRNHNYNILNTQSGLR